MAKSKGLGQGVGLLFGGNENEEKYFECNIEKIVPNKYQPRTHFDPKDLEELAASIKEKGVIQPLVVTHPDEDDVYNLVAGERRLRASKIAGLATVPVIVIDVPNEDTLLELALIENIQRTDLNPIEEAEAYQKLIEKFGYTQEETAQRVGKNRSTISNMLRLLNLPEFIKNDVVAGILSEGHARTLLRLSDDLARMKDIRDLVTQKKLSVRQTEKLVKKSTSSTQRTPNKPSPPEQIPQSYCKALATQLTNRLGSNVNIHQNGSRGKLEIEYYSLDDLERLVSFLTNEHKE